MKKLKLIALFMALMMVMSMAFTACKPNNSSSESEDAGASEDVSVDESSEEESSDPDDQWKDLALEFGSGYTYNGTANSLPTAWNSHTYQSNDATTVTGYTTDSLYTFDYNDAKDGYVIVPAMAKDFPVDVTADYVGKYGIEEGDANKAYKIDLRDDLKFDNGDPITAATFVESYKLLLNPEAANYRADSYFKGNLTIHNSRNYFYNGQTVYDPAKDVYGDSIVWTEKSDLIFDATNVAAFADIFGTSDMTLLAGYASYFTVGGVNYYEKLMAAAGESGRAPLTQAIFDDLKILFSDGAPLQQYWNWAVTEIGYFTVVETVYPEMTFENNVGFFADEDGDLVVINDNELDGFYLKYSLSTDFFLVHPDTYKACEGTSAGVYTNKYGTSVGTYVGFGPYKLTNYVADSEVRFERNPHWYGYNDQDAGAGYYQTDKIVIRQVSGDATRLNMFLKGLSDSYGLQAADMDDYQQSRHTYYTDGDSTWFVAINPSVDGLTKAQAAVKPVEEGNEVNKTILTVKEFRQALSFSIDRAAYALALDPLGGTAKALYGNMIISDPESGTAYRTTDEAKKVIIDFWGLTEEVQELGYADGIYETMDDAIASITGYDLAGAKELFNQAFDIAVSKKLISEAAAESGNFEIHIMIGQPGSGSSAYYNNGYELLKTVWTDAVKDTKLEGKIVFSQSQPLGSTAFSDYLKDNSVDVLFGVGWTGSALDPYGLMEAYVAPNYQYDPGWDTSATPLDIHFDSIVTETVYETDDKGDYVLDADGNKKVKVASETLTDVTLRASVLAWGAQALSAKTIACTVLDAEGNATDKVVYVNAGTKADAKVRLTILAKVEGAVLNQYDMIPINLDSSANLKGMKINYGTEHYVYGVGRGGIKYMTYNYTDTAWAQFVSSQGGTLNYK